MTESDIKKMVNDEIKKFVNDVLDKEIKKNLANTNSQSRGEVVNLVRTAMESVYKILWQKKSFWTGEIK